MKAKPFSKKLMLKKATIVNLSDLQQQWIRGGAPLTSATGACNSQCVTTVCCPSEEVPHD